MPLIKEILDDARDPLARREIVRGIEKLYVARGGKLVGPGSTTPQVKKALALMREAGQITPVGHRHYIAANSSDASGVVDVETDDESDADNEIEDNDEIEPTIKILSEIGEGAEKVYVYFFERDRELAAYRKEDFWLPARLDPQKQMFLAASLVKELLLRCTPIQSSV